MLLSKCFVRFGAGMLLPLCVLLSQWCVQFGVGMLVPAAARCWMLEGAAVRVVLGAGMLVSGCRWKVLLEGAVELACWWWCKGDA